MRITLKHLRKGFCHHLGVVRDASYKRRGKRLTDEVRGEGFRSKNFRTNATLLHEGLVYSIREIFWRNNEHAQVTVVGPIAGKKSA